MLKKQLLGLIILLLMFPFYCLADENTDDAWEALSQKDFASAEELSRKCINQKRAKALDEQQQIRIKRQQKATEIEDEQTIANDYAELHEAGTACFIQAEIHKRKGRKAEARQKYKEIVDNYPDALCWDPRGWFWKVADVAKDRMELMDTKYDYEDYTSKTLTGKSWQALKDKDFKGVELYAKKSVYLYEKKARQMKSQRERFAKGNKEIYKEWALNDVATCYYMLGEIYLQQGKDAQARQMYKKATDLGFALCWDPRGWFWKVAEVAQDRIDLAGTKYDYGDYRSVTLTINAWKALSEKDGQGVELYCKKCIYLYEEKAQEMNQPLRGLPKGSFTPRYWALNDVATCYFILGELYRLENKTTEARQMYQTVLQKYQYAQCWDKRGWYWQVALASQKRLQEIK